MRFIFIIGYLVIVLLDIDFEFDYLGLPSRNGETGFYKMLSGIFEGDGLAGNRLVVEVPAHRTAGPAGAAGLDQCKCELVTYGIRACTWIEDVVVIDLEGGCAPEREVLDSHRRTDFHGLAGGEVSLCLDLDVDRSVLAGGQVECIVTGTVGSGRGQEGAWIVSGNP